MTSERASSPSLRDQFVEVEERHEKQPGAGGEEEGTKYSD